LAYAARAQWASRDQAARQATPPPQYAGSAPQDLPHEVDKPPPLTLALKEVCTPARGALSKILNASCDGAAAG
jgi:hypothetical protein